MRDVLGDLVGEPRDRQCLQPDRAWSRKVGEEDAISAEDGVFEARNGGDVEADGSLECTHMSGMDAQSFAGSEVLQDELAGELDPGGSLACNLLEDEAVAAEDACAEGLLEA